MPSMKTIRVRGPEGDLVGSEAGPGDAPRVLFLHGFPDDRWVWSHQLQKLGAELKVAAFDMRGVGDSDPPRVDKGYRLDSMLDDLRAISRYRDSALPVYGAAETLENLRQKFAYVFDEDMRPLPGTLKPEGRLIALTPGETVRIGDAEVTPVVVPHGNVVVFAYRIGPLAYVTDAKTIPPAALALLKGARVLVLNALFRTEHPTHLSIPEAVAMARAIGAERTYLTHLTHDNLHADLEAELPPGVMPAFDGLTVRIDSAP